MIYQRLKIFLEQFVPISDEEFIAIRKYIIIREVNKKDFLIREGENEQYIYFVAEGLLHQFFLKGKETVSTDFMREGSMTGGVVSFFSGKPSYYYVQALEKSILFGISREQLEFFYKTSKKWQILGRLLLTHYLLTQEKEIIDTIRLTMRERFVQFAQLHPDLLERVPQRRIASYLNIKPETFSRLKPLLANE
jgi:CRP-like cAMP-binding protein